MKTKIVTARGYQYEIGDEPNPFDSYAQVGDYTLSATGVPFKYSPSLLVLWLNGCPKIVASNNPALLLALPTLPHFEDVSKFEVVDKGDAFLPLSREEFQSKLKNEAMELSKISNQMIWTARSVANEDVAGKFEELNQAISSVYQIYNRLTFLSNSYKP